MTQAAASPQNEPRSETYAPHDWKAEDFASEKYRAVNIHNFEQLPQIQAMPEEIRRAVTVVGKRAAVQVEPLRC